MKLNDLKTATKPFIKTDRLTVSIAHLKKRMHEFIVVIDGDMKKFPIKSHKYLDTLKQVIKFIEKRL